MLRNLSKYCLFICCKQSSSTHFCHFLTTAFVTDVLAGSNPTAMGPKKKGSHCWEPINSVVGDEGCPRAAGAARFRFVASLLACCAGKRFAFPQLRTLAGSNPMRWAQTKNGPSPPIGQTDAFPGWSDAWPAHALRIRTLQQLIASLATAVACAQPSADRIVRQLRREYSKTIAPFTSYPLKVTRACHSP